MALMFKKRVDVALGDMV